jgi:quercetin dioxygenase-like cupin family protein
MTTLTQTQADARHIKRGDYVSCTVAFIDCKKPGSHLKENYSIIGPGVTSSAEQVINLPEPHGFNIGAAAMPHGITNNLHVHFTAEVFIVQKGEWTFRWGSNGENTFVGHEGDILSVPTWVFRGFTNTGPDDGWLFTVLGGDNTGGVIFHPDIITEAAGYGLYISNENTLIDTSRGDPVPGADDTIPPMPAEEVARLRDISPEVMRQRVVTNSERDFRVALIDSGGAELAPVIGHGMTQNRDHAAPITNAHGFSVEWLRLAAGQSISPFTLSEKMVLIMRKGKIRLSLNEGGTVVVGLRERETYSVPAGVVRALETIGDNTAEALVVVSGDQRKVPQFSDQTLQSARAQGLSLDAGGYIAIASLLPNYKRG